MAGMVVVFVFKFVLISISSFVLILGRIILNVSLLKSLNPGQNLSWCLPGKDHHNHLLTSFQPLRELLIKLTLKTWSYILNCNLLSEVVSNNSSHLLNIIDIYGLTQLITRLRVVPHFYSGIVEWAKRERAWKSPHARKGVSPFLAWGDFHARSPFARSPIPEKKWLSNLLQNQLESHNIQVPWSIYA